MKDDSIYLEHIESSLKKIISYSADYSREASAVPNQPINLYLEPIGLIIDTPILSPSLITVS